MKSKTLRNVLMLALIVALTLGVIPTSVVHAATITVNTTDDELNNDGDCSLREAIQAANTDTTVDKCTPGSGDDTIYIPVGTYIITLPGGENNNLTGDFDITSSMTLQGAGQAATIINGNGIDRVFEVNGYRNAVDVTLSDMTTTNGKPAPGGGNSNGGGIFAHGRGKSYSISSLTVQRCNFMNNVGGNGGGITIYAGVVTTVDASTISDNWGSYAGGGIYVTHPLTELTLTNSTVKNNYGGNGGGGLNVYASGRMTIANTTISGNEGGLYGGGGLKIWKANFENTIANSTIVDNTAYRYGGIHQHESEPVFIRNTILANNSSTTGSGPDCYGTIVSDKYNLVEDPTDCSFTPDATDIVGIDPLLAALANNGGNTETHAPLEGSPAFDVIPVGVNGCGTTYTTDQRGMTRPTGPGCDIGAYEDSDTVADADEDGVPDDEDVLPWL